MLIAVPPTDPVAGEKDHSTTGIKPVELAARLRGR